MHYIKKGRGGKITTDPDSEVLRLKSQEHDSMFLSMALCAIFSFNAFYRDGYISSHGHKTSLLEL